MARPEITGQKLQTRSAAEDEFNLNDRYLTATQVRQRYGNASNMWLHRRLHDDSGFPRPDLVVNGRRFWRVSSLIRWERKQVTAGVR